MKTRPKQSNTLQNASNSSLQQYLLFLIPCLLFAWSIGYAYWGEILAVRQGYGWDGLFYADVAWRFEDFLKNRWIDSYRATRILPSGIVHYLGITLGLRLDAPLHIFKIYNAGIVVISGLLWVLIGRAAKLKTQSVWLGAIALFVNYAVLKYSFYYPTLTDASAFCLGLLMLYCYVVGNIAVWFLPVIACIGFFTWPTAFYQATILFVFPATLVFSSTTDTRNSKISLSRLQYIVFAMFFAMIIACTIYFIVVNPTQYPGPLPEKATSLLLYPSIASLFVFAGYALFYIVKYFPLPNIKDFSTQVQIGIKWVVMILLAMLCFTIKFSIEDVTLPVNATLFQFIGGNLTASATKPLVNIVGHAVFLGPITLLLILRYREICRLAFVENGYGIGLLFSLSVIAFCLVAEARQLMCFFPIIVFVVIKALDKRTITVPQYLIIAVLSLASSMIWYNINFPGMENFAEAYPEYTKFPMQRYFMRHAPWMNMESYMIQGGGQC